MSHLYLTVYPVSVLLTAHSILSTFPLTVDRITSTVLTLTAPSLWSLISCSDTLSLYHANGPSHPPGCHLCHQHFIKDSGEQRDRLGRHTQALKLAGVCA